MVVEQGQPLAHVAAGRTPPRPVGRPVAGVVGQGGVIGIDGAVGELGVLGALGVVGSGVAELWQAVVAVAVAVVVPGVAVTDAVLVESNQVASAQEPVADDVVVPSATDPE